MGTRALTVVKDKDDKEIICMYSQCDGYISGHGAELFEFLKDRTVLNGIPLRPAPAKSANGIYCLAAQIVAYFKEGLGGIYLYPPPSENVEQSYNYTVYIKEGKICLSANVGGKSGSILFDGIVDAVTEEQFLKCEDDDEEEDD